MEDKKKNQECFTDFHLTPGKENTVKGTLSTYKWDEMLFQGSDFNLRPTDTWETMKSNYCEVN